MAIGQQFGMDYVTKRTDGCRALGSPRTVNEIEFTGIISSIAHLAYHVGAIRQINKDARGPREGTF